MPKKMTAVQKTQLARAWKFVDWIYRTPDEGSYPTAAMFEKKVLSLLVAAYNEGRAEERKNQSPKRA